MRASVLWGAAAFVVLGAFPALSAEVTINMVNKDSQGHAMQFEPSFVKVASGDTVHFVAKDKGHDSQAIPAGAEAWKGKMSEDVTVTLTQPGLYAFKCLPHVGLGMVGLIQVGDDTSNLDAVKATKVPGKARAKLDELLAQVTPK